MKLFDDPVTTEEWARLADIMDGKAAPEGDFFRDHRLPEETPDKPGQFVSGVMGGGVYGTAAAGLGAAGLVSDIVGADGAKKFFFDKAQAVQAAADEKYPQSANLETVLDNPSLSNIGDFVAYNAGQLVPNLVLSATGGGAGGLAAKTFIKDASAEAVKKAALAGTAAAFLPVESGGNWIESAAERGLDNTRPGLDLAFGAGQASLEMLGIEGGLVKKFLGDWGESAFKEAVKEGNSEAAKGLLRSAAKVVKESGSDFVKEGLQELSQEELAILNQYVQEEDFNPGKEQDYLSPERNMRRGEAFAAGGVMGGISGATTGAYRQAFKNKPSQTSETNTAQPQGEGQQSATVPQPKNDVVDILADDNAPMNAEAVDHNSPAAQSAKVFVDDMAANDPRNPVAFSKYKEGLKEGENADALVSSLINQQRAIQPKKSGVVDILDESDPLDDLKNMNPPERQKEISLQNGINPAVDMALKTGYAQSAGFPSDVFPGDAKQAAATFDARGRQTEQQKLAGLLGDIAQAKQQAEIQSQDQAVVQSPIGADLLRQKLEQEQLAAQEPYIPDHVPQNPEGLWNIPNTEPVIMPRVEPEIQAENIYEEPKSIAKEPENIGEIPTGARIEWSDKSGNTLAGKIIGVKGNRYEIERENPKPGQGRKTFLHTNYDIRAVEKPISIPESPILSKDGKGDEKTDDFRLVEKNREMEPAFTEPESNYNSVADVKEKPKNNSAGRLEETAKKLLADAEAREAQDRQTNTYKRANQAASAIAKALSDKNLAKTMISLTDSMKRGTARYLGGVKSKADLETIGSIMRRAVLKTENDKKHYSDRDADRSFIESKDAGNIKYPYPSLHIETINDLMKGLDKVRGGKKLSEKILSVRRRSVVNSMATITRKEDVELVREAVRLLPPDRDNQWLKKRIQDNFIHYDRVQRMGIKDAAALEQAILEYSALKAPSEKEDPVKALEREIYTQKNIGIDFFPTSKEVAADMAERLDIKPGMSVLEPSAGSGRLIDAVKESEPSAKIEAVEMSSKLRELLSARGDNVVEHNFMDLEKDKLYDRIIMNPPFSNGLDIEHVMKAYEHLKPGGKMAAIMGEGAFFRNDKKATGFREWLDEVGGTNEKLPDGSFKHSDMVQKTGVNARLVEIEKPGKRNLYGKTGSAFLPDNAKIDFKYRIAEASEPVASHDHNFSENPAYPQEIQPRERGKRDALKLQVESMANAINPEKIAESATLSSGAPVVGKDGIVESGNGRIIALRKAYSDGRAGEYKKWLSDNAERFGFNKAQIDAMKNPVLLRERQTDVEDRSLFAKLANKDEVARMSASEDAASDADLITTEDLKVFAPSEDGDIGAYSNKSFINRFLGKLSAPERAGYLTDDGRATRQLVDRIRSAVFHKAYESNPLTSLAAEEANPDIKNILNALLAAAPEFVRAKAFDEKLANTGIVDAVVEAVDIIRRARNDYEGVQAADGQTKLYNQVEAAVSQAKLFNKDNESEEGKRLALYIATNIRSAKRIGLFLKHLAGSLREYLSDLNQKTMFGDKADFSVLTAINNAERALKNEQAEGQELWSNNSRNEQADGRNKQPGHRRAASEIMGSDSKGIGISETGENGQGEAGLKVSEKETHFSVQKDIKPYHLGFEKMKAEGSKGENKWAVVDVETTGYIAAKGFEVKGHDDAAALVSGLQRLPQENLYFICVNKDGIVTEVNRHSVGNSKSAYHDNISISSRVFANPDTAVVYTAHNHPGGSLEPSGGDVGVFNSLQKILSSKDIKAYGIIVGDGEYTVYDRDDISEPAKIPAVVAKTKIPVKERVLVRKAESGLGILNSPSKLEAAASAIGRAFVFLNGSLKPLGVLPFPSGMDSRELASLILQKAGETNATRYALVTDKLSDEAKAFLAAMQGNEHDLELIDVVVDGKSQKLADKSIEADKKGFTTINKGFTVYSLADKKPSAGISANLISKEFSSLASRLPHEIVQSESDLPQHIKKDISDKGFSGRAEALFDHESGKVFFIADNIGSVQAAQTGFLENLVRHEGRHAAISQMFESKGSRNMFMDRAARAFKQDVEAYLDKNGLENSIENVRMAAEEVLVDQTVKGGIHAILDEFANKVARWARKIFSGLSMTRAEARAFIRRADAMLKGDIFSQKEGFSDKSDEKGSLETEKPEIRYSVKDRESVGSLKDLGIAAEYSDAKAKDAEGNETSEKRLVITGPFKDEYKKLMPLIGGEYKYRQKNEIWSRQKTGANTYIFKNPAEDIEQQIVKVIRAYHELDNLGLEARFKKREDGSTVLFVDGHNLHMLDDTMKKIGGRLIKPQDGRKPYLVFNGPETATPNKIASAAKAFNDTLGKMHIKNREKGSEVFSEIVSPVDESARARGKRLIEDIKSLFSKSDIVLPSNNTDFTKGIHELLVGQELARKDAHFKEAYDINAKFEAMATQMTTRDREDSTPYYELDKEERKPVNAALLAGDGERKSLSDKEAAARFKLSEAQIKGFRAIRNLLDNKLVQIVSDMLKHAFAEIGFDAGFAKQVVEAGSRDEVSRMLKDHGVDKKQAENISWLFDWISERKGYIPHKWDSEWLVRVNMPDGDTYLLPVPTITGNILPTKALREGAANKAAVRAIKERIGWSDEQIKEWMGSGNISLVKSKEPPIDLFHGASMHVMSSIIDAATDRAWEEQKDSFSSEQLMKQADLKAAIRKEMEELFLAKGAGKHFIARKGVKGFRTDLDNVLAEYVGGMNHWMVKRDKAMELSKVMGKVDPKNTPEKFKALRSFIDDMLGESHEVPWFKRFAGVWFMGLDVSAVALNGFQNFTHALPKLIRIKGNGSAMKGIVKAMQDAFGEWNDARKTGRQVFTGTSKFVSSEEMKIIRKLYEEGFFDPALVGEMTGFHPTKVWNQYADNVTKFMLGAFTGMEALNRSSTFLAAYRRAVEAGEAKPIEVAKQLVMDAHFGGGKANRPQLVRKMGILGNIGYTFMVYPINNLFFLKNLFVDAWNARGGKGDLKTELKAVGAHLGALFTLGGLAATPFASIWAPLVKGIFSDDDDDWEIALRKHMPPEFGRLLVRGLPALMGNDMSGRVSSDVIGMPAGFGVINTMYRRAMKAGNYAVQGNYLDSVMVMSPDFMRNPYNAVQGMMYGGEKNGVSPTKFNLWQGANKALGFSPTVETEAYAKMESMRNVQAKKNDTKAHYAERLLQLHKKNDINAISKLRKEFEKAQSLQKKDDDPVLKWSDVIKAERAIQKKQKKGYMDRMPKTMKQQRLAADEAMGG